MSKIEKNRVLLDMIEQLAKEKKATPTQISLAWMLCKKSYIVPIPGTKKTERILEKAGAVDVLLTTQEIEK